MTEAKQSRVSRDDWLKAGLELLLERGVEAVKIDHLANRVGVAKTGFYWHFKNRRALLDAMLEYWEQGYTAVVSSDQKLASLPPAQRLCAINEIVDRNHLAEYDLAIAHWAQHDKAAASALAQAYQVRLDYVGQAFRELGFTGDELTMRIRLFVCYVSNAPQMFGDKLTARDRRIRKLRNRLLIQQLTEN